jgi:hypothetical protein
MLVQKIHTKKGHQLGWNEEEKLQREIKKKDHHPVRGFRRDEEKKRTLEGVLGSTGKKKGLLRKRT